MATPTRSSRGARPRPHAPAPAERAAATQAALDAAVRADRARDYRAFKAAMAALRALQRVGTVGPAALERLLALLPGLAIHPSYLFPVIQGDPAFDAARAEQLLAQLSGPNDAYLRGWVLRHRAMPVDLVYRELVASSHTSAATSAARHPAAVRDPRVRERLLVHHSSSSFILQHLLRSATPEEFPVLLDRLARAHPARAARVLVQVAARGHGAIPVTQDALTRMLSARGGAARTLLTLGQLDVRPTFDAPPVPAFDAAAVRARRRARRADGGDAR